MECLNCKKLLGERPKKYSVKQWAKRQFCSRKCKGIKQKPEALTNYRGGVHVTKKGYVYRYQPQHPHKNNKQYVVEHRLVMEKHIGRYLKREEDVHHINGITNDNRIENLELLSHSEHARRHAIENGLGTNKYAYGKTNTSSRRS